MKRMILLLGLLLSAVFGASARETWPLSDGWSFFFGYENGGDRARPVSLPHTWNLDALAGACPYLRTQGNYARELYIPREWEGRRIFLRFGGAESVADLFVNGIHAGEHRGGRTAFAFEITDRVKWGAVNTLLVAVSNAARNDVLPTSAEHNLYGGLYRSVELLVTDAVAVSPLHKGSEGVLVRQGGVTEERAEGVVEVHVVAPQGVQSRLSLRIEDADGDVVFRRTQKVHAEARSVEVPYTVDRPRLWSPDNPALYRVTARIETDRTVDSVCVNTGFRAIELTAREGLRINARRVVVHGVSLTYDRPAAGPVWDHEACASELALLGELGATALRSPAGPHEQALYDGCDTTGVIVWIDLPFMRAPFAGELPYYGTGEFEGNGREQLEEIIAQNINHPSVVLWGLFSALRPVDARLNDYIGALQALAHAQDPSRPTVACSNQNGRINFLSDGIVWRQDAGWLRGKTDDVSIWSEVLHDQWADLRSAVAYGAEGDVRQQTDEIERATPFTTWLPERRQTLFHEEYARQLMEDSLFWGVWIDQLADYASVRRADGRNRAGLVDFGRRERKDAFYLYKALWNPRQTTVHIAERRWTPRTGDKQVIKVYASQGVQPELLLDGDTVALSAYAPCQWRTEPLALEGVVVVEARAGETADRAVIRCGNDLKEPPQQDLLQTIGLQPTD